MIFLSRLPVVEELLHWESFPVIEKKPDASSFSTIGRSDNSFVRVLFVVEFVEMEILYASGCGAQIELN